MLSPAERLILSTCKSRQDMLKVMRAARNELINPGSGRFHQLDFPNAIRYVLLIGIARQPVLYLIGPIVAVVSYVVFLVSLF